MPLARTEAENLEIDRPTVAPDSASSLGATPLARTRRVAEPSALSDAELLRSVARWAALERRTTAELLRHLAELDLRHLYLGAGCASTFAYCTERLRMSESAAYHRITAARLGRRFPELLERLEASDLHLSGICLLAPVLTEANLADWVARARGQSKRAIERMLQRERETESAKAHLPRVDPAGALFRAAIAGEGRSAPMGGPKVDTQNAEAAPADRLAVGDAAAASFVPREIRASVVPGQEHRTPSARQDRITVTVDAEMHELIDQARDLVRHRNPSGDLATLLRLALRTLIAATERRRFGLRPKTENAGGVAAGPAEVTVVATAAVASRVPPEVTAEVAAVTAPATAANPAYPRRRAPRPQARNAGIRSRYIPAAVRRAVWQRDRGRCAFRSPDGHQCDARGFLQFHHLVPFAQGGAHTVENLALRCGPHNRYEAKTDLGGIAVRVARGDRGCIPHGDPTGESDRRVVLGVHTIALSAQLPGGVGAQGSPGKGRT
ncbi:MAG: HNH endonuclease [Candidatus Eisenbacteria bacterium]|nr:HNH endonuclease [Candidatus Eisenbacteria bacterium]